MRKGKTDSSFKKVSTRVVVLVIGAVLGVSFLVSGATFSKWSAAISQMTGANIQIGDWRKGEPPVISTEDALSNGKVGEAFNVQFEASHSEDAVWTIRDRIPGLTLSPDGLLSGTPTYSGVHAILVTVTNGTGSDKRIFNLTINPSAPKFDETQELPDAFDGVDYKRFYLAASGESKTFELTSGELPSGMVFSRGGSIYGTPVGYGLFTFTVTVSNPGGSDSREFTLNLNSDYPYITTSSFPVLTKDEYYNFPLTGSGPSPTYALVSGDLPTGMTLNTSTGVITGRARSHGIATFTISKTNTLGSVTKDFSMDVRYAAPTLDATSFPTVRKNVGYSYQIAGTGEGVTYAITEGSLPVGLTLDPTSGLISGTTLQVGDFTFTVRKSNESGTVSRSYTLNSLLVAPRIPYNASVPGGYMDAYYEHQIIATGEEIVWTATGLPDGLSIDPATGVISGTPTGIIAKYITVTATNGGGSSTSDKMYLNVRSPLPEILTTSIPDAEVGTAYSATFEAVGYGVTTRITTNHIPSGLTYDVKTGILSGIPTKSGTYTMNFYATTSGGSIMKPFTLFIDKDFPTFTTTSLETASQNVRYTSTPLGGAGEGSTYSITDGIMPPGMSVNTSGNVTGTPNANAHGSYTFTVTKTNSRGSVSREFSIDVVYQEPTLTGTGGLGQIRLTRAYSFTFPGVGNGATYSVIEGALPEGVTLDSSAGTLTGPATVTGDFTFTIQKSNESGTVSKAYTLQVIHVAPVLVTTSLDRATIGVPYSMQLKATGLDIVYSISSGTLPAGITLDPDTGVISGTPTVSGSPYLNIKASNSGGYDTLGSTFHVDEVAPMMVTTSLPSGKVKDPYYAKIEGIGEALAYSVYSGSLPSGLVLNASTGEITGTPTTAVVSNVSFAVRNSGGTVRRTITMTIFTQNPTIATETFTDGIVGSSYTQTLTGEGTSNTVTISKGELPPGLRINSSSGSVTGTPTARGTYTFTITKTNVSGTVSKEFTLTVKYATPTFTTPASGPLKDAVIGQNYSVVIYGVGVIPTDGITYSIIEGQLPPGISLDPQPTSLRLLGTPTTPGNYTFTILKSNLDGEASRQFSINVPGAQVASLSNEPSAGLVVFRRFWE